MSIKHHFHGCQKRHWYVLRLLSGAISSTWLYLFFGTKQNCQTKTKTKYRSSSEISRRVLCQTVYRTPSLQYFYGKTQTRFANCLTILLWSHVKHSRIVTTLSNSLRETKTWFAGSCNKTHLTQRIMRSVWEYGVRTLSGVYVMSYGFLSFFGLPKQSETTN